jgi:hypothetical protein
MFLFYRGKEYLVVNRHTNASLLTKKVDQKSQTGFTFTFSSGVGQNIVDDSTIKMST